MLCGGEGFESFDVANHQSIRHSCHQVITLESTHDSNDGFCGSAHHVRHVLAGEPHGQLDPLRILATAACGEINQQGGQSLVCSIHRENLRFLLCFIQAIAQVLDHFQCRVRAPSQHVEIRFFAHPEYADIPHRLGAAGVGGPVEGRRIAAKEIPGHQHLEGAFFSIWIRLDAFDRAFLDDVEVFGRVAFAENELALAVAGLGEFVQDPLAVLHAQNVEQWNPIELDFGRRAWAVT